jgi:hypothetical protein
VDSSASKRSIRRKTSLRESISSAVRCPMTGEGGCCGVDVDASSHKGRIRTALEHGKVNILDGQTSV